MVSRQREHLLHLGIMKGAHGHSAKAQRHSFQQQVLGGVAGFKVSVAAPAGRSILLSRAFIDGGHHKNSFRLTDGLLRERGLAKRRPQIVCRDAIQAVLGRVIMVKTCS